MIKHSLDTSLLPKHRMKKAKNIPSNPAKHCIQYAEAAIKAGFPVYEVNVVTYVAWKESRCIPDVANLKDKNGGSFGLMQINNVWTRRLIREGIIKSRNELYNPQKNMNAAFFVWTQSIKTSRYGWKPWQIS
jgi:soluble lytic murein transglycosylase-like protein